MGWLASTLIPSSKVEQRAATQVMEKAQPLVDQAKEQVTQVASDVKDELQPRAQEAAQSLKDSASSAASTVQDQARDWAARGGGCQVCRAGRRLHRIGINHLVQLISSSRKGSTGIARPAPSRMTAAPFG